MKTTATVYENVPLVIDAVKVPSGTLYIVSHYEWRCMNAVFVPDTKEALDDVRTLSGNKNYIDPVKVKEFIEGKR